MAVGVRPGDLLRLTRTGDVVRVLAADDSRLCYAARAPDGGWTHHEPRRTCTYYTALTAPLLAVANAIGHEPLSAEEEALHRPDLPLTLVVAADRSWDDTLPDDDGDLVEWLVAGGADRAGAGALLPVGTIGLVPWTAQGRLGRPVLVTARGSEGLTTATIVRAAAGAQEVSPTAEGPGPGIGLYRLGLHRGAPTWYLWGVPSRLEEPVPRPAA